MNAIPPNLPVYFYPHEATFWIQDSKENWIPLGKENISDLLEVRFHITKANKATIKHFLVKCIEDRSVAFAGPIAGHSSGLLDFQGRRMLVTENPVLIKPAPGTWPLWDTFLRNLFIDPIKDQRVYYFGWLQHAAKALREGKRCPGQCLAVAGPRDCGKSFWQNMTTPLLGGRAAKPYQYMSGDSNFNREMFGAEHLMIEDVIAATDIKSRRNFGNRIKELTANELQTCYGKYADASNVHPFWRTTITVNDEPENLMVLPPFDSSVGDKFILLKAGDGKIPTDVDRDAYRTAVLAELPHFLHWLLHEFKLPADLWSRRFGVAHWHHPDLVASINEMSPESQLHSLLHTHIFTGDTKTWTGTSEELRIKLTSLDKDATKALLYFNNACGTYLGRLHEAYPDRYLYKKTNRSRVWTLLADAPAETVAP